MQGRTYYIVGTNYPSNPGRYEHPNKNGTFTIYMKGEHAFVRNETRGNTQGYQHRYWIYTKAYQSVQMMHEQFFFDITSSPG